MTNSSIPSETPASLSAAELRRRLLASTPPPMVGSGSAPSLDLDATEAAATTPSAWGADVLTKLRLPNQPSGTVPMPEPVPEPAPAPPTGPPPVLGQLPGGRRSPIVGVRFQGAPEAVTQTTPPRDSRRDEGTSDDVRRLKSENKELRKLLAEMKQLLQEASETEQQTAAREQEHQVTLVEKQRQIDELSAQLQAIEEQIANGTLAPQQPVGPPKTRTELEEWSDELEKESAKLTQERRKMDDERRQLHEDEEALEKQMRDMEVGMARERAIMARQETELKRLATEIQHDLEVMQRGDATLREHMQKFQRRAQDVMAGKPGGGNTQSSLNMMPRR